MIDSLEQRRHLSVTLSGGGTLSVVGTNGVDTVQFAAEHKQLAGDTEDQNVILVDLNGVQAEFHASDVARIQVSTSAGADLVVLGRVNKPSIINGGRGNDILSGGNGDDQIFGGGGADYLYGRIGNDALQGDVGYDNMLGGPGDDSIVPDSDLSGDDTIFGQEGNDIVTYAARTDEVAAFVTVGAPAITTDDRIAPDIESLIGGSGDDLLVNGTRRGIVILGGAGNDTLQGGGGSDTLDGESGTDLLLGVAGHDHFIAGDGTLDSISGGTGSDVLDSTDAGLDVVSGVP
jgi:Ca2+-binding RTX toxin-like protein